MLKLFKRKNKQKSSVTVEANGARSVDLKMLLESPHVREQLRAMSKIEITSNKHNDVNTKLYKASKKALDLIERSLHSDQLNQCEQIINELRDAVNQYEEIRAPRTRRRKYNQQDVLYEPFDD